MLGAHLLQGGDELRGVGRRGPAGPAKTSSRKPSRAWYSIGAVAGSEAIAAVILAPFVEPKACTARAKAARHSVL